MIASITKSACETAFALMSYQLAQMTVIIGELTHQS